MEIEYNDLILTLSKEESVMLRDLLLYAVRSVADAIDHDTALTTYNLRHLLEFGRKFQDRLNI